MTEQYRYSVSKVKETGFPIVSCTDTKTGIVVRTIVASKKMSFPSFTAYIGAKFSRSREGAVELSSQVYSAYKQGKLVPENNLGKIVEGLKHQSPAGMSHVVTVMENIPIATAAAEFRETSLHDGQEASTRFIDFESGNDLPGLETLLPEGAEVSPETKRLYSGLQKTSLEYYKGWFGSIYEAYRDHFKIDVNDKKQESALTARTFDTVRGFLLSGFKTSMIYVTNATNMQQLISQFEADRVPGEKQLADALIALLKPEKNIPGYVPEIRTLLNHTEPNLRNKTEQSELKKFFNEQPGFSQLLSKRRNFSNLTENRCQLISNSYTMEQRMVAQHIINIYPSLRMEDALGYAATMSESQMGIMGTIIFKDRNRFYLPSLPSSVGAIAFNMEIDYGIERDLGRHRAWERVSAIHETFEGLGEIANTGFVQAAYLRQIPKFKEIQKGMERDMIFYYQKRDEFMRRLTEEVGREAADRVGFYLLPLAHQVNMVMNGDERFMIHLEDLRIREGVHIDVRSMMAEANKLLAEASPLFSSQRYPDDRVIVDSREQFIDRS